MTTEGGLDVAGLKDRLVPIIERLKREAFAVSLFIDPESSQLEAAAALGADFVELHTGTYANLADAVFAGRRSKAPARFARLRRLFGEQTRAELEKLRVAARLARSLKLKPNVGHGLNYQNVGPVAAIPGLSWMHIGHSIVARAVMVGMGRAVREMNLLINKKPAAANRR